MAAPAWASAGTAQTASTFGTFDVNIPSHAAGDLLVLVVHTTSTNSTANKVTAINTANWAQLGGAGNSYGQGQIDSVAIGWKIGDGAETLVNYTCTGGTAGRRVQARVHKFTSATGFAATAVANVGTPQTGTGTTVTMPSVTPSDINQRAVAAVCASISTTMASATGETGGDWTEATAEAANTNGTSQLQTSDQSGGGGISGGTLTISSATWITVGFTVIPGILATVLETGAIAVAGSDISTSTPATLTLDGDAAGTASGSDITPVVSFVVTLEGPAASTVAGIDASAALSAPLDGPAAAAGIGADITPTEQPSGNTVVLDVAAASIGSADLLAPSAPILDSAAISAAGLGNVAALTTVTAVSTTAPAAAATNLAVTAAVPLDSATAAGAGQELTTSLAPGVTLDQGTVGAQAFELPAAITIVVPDASATAAGADLDLIITPYVLLETAEVAVIGEPVELGEAHKVTLDQGAALASGNLVAITPPDVTFQDFDVAFGGQSFDATFGETKILEAVA